MNLPPFSNEKELGFLIHLDPGLINIFCKGPFKYYKEYKIPKSKGGFRTIREPIEELKGIQAWILRNILDRLTPSPYATAYIKEKNISHNISPHLNNRYFICLDLEDFFPSISVRRVNKVFSLLGYCKRAARILARLCTCYLSLPQGAVTSPSLSNVIAAKLDRRIAGYTSRRNIIYTRYADDITLSSNNYRILCQALPRILNIIRSEHFKPNLEKLRVLGPRRRCSITGLVKNNSESKFGIGRRKKREMRAIMHHCLLNLSKDEKYCDAQSIAGWLNFLKGVDKDSFEQMDYYWNRLKEKANSN